MAYARIEIYKKNQSVVSGRTVEAAPTLYYAPLPINVSNLYGAELYGALDIRLENTIVFEVRYCKLIAAMRTRLKEFYIVYAGDKYDIYAVDFRNNDKQFVLLKANRKD